MPSKTTAFDRDVLEHGGFRYTTDAPLSSQMANERLTLAVLDAVPLAGRRLLDVGCGDGTYTAEWVRRGNPRETLGVDVAAEAVRLARERYGALEGTSFEVADSEDVVAGHGRFDVAILRGVLHHADDPRQVIHATAAVADDIVVVEPNGYSPVLKVIEKVSPYHREHAERSFAPRRVRAWLQSAGMTVTSGSYVGLVPMFAPALAARALKRVEPLFERSRIATVACAVYVVRGQRV